jgi:ribosomal protein L1
VNLKLLHFVVASSGALVVGAEDLVAAIQAGNINFDKCIATPDMMPLVGKVARVRETSDFLQVTND